MAIKWIFFDIGDVLFDENAQHQYYFHSLLRAIRRNGIEVEWDDYHRKILELVQTAPSTCIVDAGKFFVQDADLWDKIYHEGRAEYQEMRKPRPYGQLLDNITPVIKRLNSTYKLGVIANQHPPIIEALNDYGISKYLSEIIIDEIVGVSKPNPAIFQLALERAGCKPEESIMVGDRPDNDIAPANKIGMKTIRFRRGMLYSFCEPRNEIEKAQIEITSCDELESAITILNEKS